MAIDRPLDFDGPSSREEFGWSRHGHVRRECPVLVNRSGEGRPFARPRRTEGLQFEVLRDASSDILAFTSHPSWRPREWPGAGRL